MSEPPHPGRTLGVRLRRLAVRAGRALDRDARRREAGFEALRRRFYDDFWRRSAEAVGATCEELDRGFLRIRRHDRWTLVRGDRVPVDDPVTLALAGDKPVSRRILAQAGLPTVPQVTFTLAEVDEAAARLAGFDAPGVVKPAYGTGGGHGVTTGIDSMAALRRAARDAADWCPLLLLEPQWPGHSVRLLYLQGRLLDAVRRDPPCVTGDGRRSVAALMKAETEARLGGDAIRALSPLTVDLDCRATLRAAGWRVGAVLPEGRRVVVKRVVNQNSAVENQRVVDEIHPSLVDLGRAAATCLGVELAGVDLFTDDPTRPASEGAVVVGEVNTTPGLHHHALVRHPSNAAPVGTDLLEHLLSRPRGGGPVTAVGG